MLYKQLSEEKLIEAAQEAIYNKILYAADHEKAVESLVLSASQIPGLANAANDQRSSLMIWFQLLPIPDYRKKRGLERVKRALYHLFEAQDEFREMVEDSPSQVTLEVYEGFIKFLSHMSFLYGQDMGLAPIFGEALKDNGIQVMAEPTDYQIFEEIPQPEEEEAV